MARRSKRYLSESEQVNVKESLSLSAAVEPITVFSADAAARFRLMTTCLRKNPRKNQMAPAADINSIAVTVCSLHISPTRRHE